MRTNTVKRTSVALILVLAILLVSVLGVTVHDGVSFAANTESAEKLDEISVGHLSDIHYFPLEHCYQDVYGENYESSEFYHSTTGDTKLVVESGLVLNATIQKFIEDAKRDQSAPSYLIASGDLSKNGERVALIDVANSLRYLQNTMREYGRTNNIEKYKNFQVFATVGNHDLYNHNGALYEQEQGKSRPADMVTAMQFAMIFAGLGFPNADVVAHDGALNLTDYFPAEYWSSEYTSGYVYSENAENLDIAYYSEALTEATEKTTSAEKLASYLNIGDGLNQLTYFASVTDKSGYSFAIIDSSDRESTNSGALVRISEQEYSKLDPKPTLYLEKSESTLSVDIDLENPVSASIAFPEDAVQNVYRRTPVQHITGGRITTECLDWVEEQADKKNQQNATDGALEETIISSFHHNVLPHFEQEDDILKDFTLYNWEYAANRLLEMGIRYALTGHMHASDAMSYTDIEGRTLYDFETGSIISYASPRRYLTIERNNCDGKLGERTISEVHVLGDIREIASSHINTALDWNEVKYQNAITTYNAFLETPHTEEQREAEWAKVVASNPDYLTYIIRYDQFATLDTSNMYNDFISQDIYTIIVDRMVSHFINQDTIDSLLKTAYGFIDGLKDDNVILKALGVNARTLHIAAEYMIDTILNNLYGESGYPLNGKTYDNALEYVVAVVNDILDLKFGDDSIGTDQTNPNPTNKGKLNVRELASFIMMSHSAGCEISLSETNASIDEKFVDTPYVGNTEQDFRRYKQPTDRTYRKRMLAAIKDFHAQLQIADGGVVDMLLSKILDPLYKNNDSLLKKLFDYPFNFSKAKWDEVYMEVDVFDPVTGEPVFDEATGDQKKEKVNAQYYSIKMLFESKLPDLIPIIGPILQVELPSMNLSYDATGISLNAIIGDLLPVAKPLLGSMLGFNMQGDTLYEIVDNLLNGYITPSFLIGLGGIADNIIMAFATDVYPDVADMRLPGNPFDIQPYGNYKYAEKSFSYLSTLNKVSKVEANDSVFNAATQNNGRVPSRVTTSFDTRNNTTSFKVKFYTAENVYGTFKFKTSENGTWNTLSTSKQNANANADYFDSSANQTFGGVTVSMLTQTKPVYLPLIDLGLLCLTHAEIESDDEIPYTYKDRDNAPKNSVVFWNVTTVTVTGLSADTTYYYDLEGSYVNGDVNASFSFAQHNKTKNNGYNKDYFTFKTARSADAENADSFEFLTVADIQGMIQGMYDDSFNAVKALLADENTKDFDFILNAGDMCDNGKNFNQWAMALDTYQPLFANSSMFFAAGNHESGSNALANYFEYTLPNNQSVTDGMYYSFNYGNAHFIVLNTNDANSSGLGSAQLGWLRNDLETNKNAKWKFVLMHKSIFSGGSHSTDAEVVAMRSQLVPLFAEKGVNIVFGGHDHTYTATHLLDKNGNVKKNTVNGEAQYTGEGVLYITLGTMGTKFYNYQENPDISSKFDNENSINETLTTQTFGKVTVDGDTITYKSYKYDKASDSLVAIGSDIALTSVAPAKQGGGLSKGALIAIIVVVVVVVLAAVAVVVILVVKKKQEEKRRKEALRRKKLAILKARQAAAAKAKAEAENNSSDQE